MTRYSTPFQLCDSGSNRGTAYVFAHKAVTLGGVRTPQHKLIEYAVNGRHSMTQLFDLAADPLELRNLADDTAHASLRRHLRRELARLRDAWDDTATLWGRTFWGAVREGAQSKEFDG